MEICKNIINCIFNIFPDFLQFKFNNNNEKSTKNLNEKNINSNNNNSSTCTTDSSSTNKDDSSLTIINNTENKAFKNFDFSKKNYCNYYPQNNEMNNGAAKKPLYFSIDLFLIINKSHNNIGNNNYLELKEDEIFSNNNYSYKKIDKKDHLLLNHYCQRKSNINKGILNSMILRYRHKNVTFIYYK